jgi:hypothetical protein
MKVRFWRSEQRVRSLQRHQSKGLRCLIFGFHISIQQRQNLIRGCAQQRNHKSN